MLAKEGEKKALSFETRDVSLANVAAPITSRAPMFAPAGLESKLAESSTVLVHVADEEAPPHWYAWVGSDPFGSDLFFVEAHMKTAFAGPPAVREGSLYGFEGSGTLLRLDVKEKRGLELVTPAGMPKGAVRGWPSIARDVLYLGNWAVELGSSRVLWCVESIDARGPAVPAGDGLIAVVTKKDDLVGLADPQRAATAAAAAPRTRPVAPSEDEALAKQLAGDEAATFDAFADVLDYDRLETLAAQFKRFAEFKLFEDCQKLLLEMKSAGLDARRADELARDIAGKPPSKAENAALQRKKIQSDRGVALEKLQARALAAADWCGQKGLPAAATALVARARALAPEHAVDVARVGAWIPPSFPWTAESDAKERWIAWAAALLPSGARFIPKDDPAWARVKGSAFEKEGVALRTENLLLFTREQTADVVGICLLRGEAAVRALGQQLGKSPIAAKTAGEPLEIRLHRTREEYLADNVGNGETPEKWSAGVYCPRDGVSRFFARSDAESVDPLARDLHAVLAHELTHHYIDRRWIPGRGAPTVPGMWLVEGYAEFIAEQAVEMSRRGASLDDATVRSLDITAAMSSKAQLLPLTFLLGLSAEGFATQLDSDKPVLIEPRHLLGRLNIDRRGLFYAESAALTFFAMHRAGDAGRKGYLELLESHYRGRVEKEPWKKLGFADCASLDKAFQEFVATL
jgi:hypothetical protein